MVKLSAVCALGFASYWSIRLAYADHLFRANTPDLVERAVRLDPGNEEYLSFWALELEYLGRDSRSTLEHAAKLNPLDSSLWIRMGLRAEMREQFAEAETDLKRAAEVDRQYEPRWTLANYYLRRGNEEAFWHWAREAFQVSYGDRKSLFQLCWKMRPRADVILRRAIPDRRQILSQFLSFLLEETGAEAAYPVAEKLLTWRDATDLPLLLRYCDRLIDSGSASTALRVWNSLCDFKLIGYQASSAGLGRFLTNGDFASAPLSHGFDWWIPDLSGVSVVTSKNPAGLKFIFNGKQPESCELLNQIVNVLPSRKYLLRFQYRTVDLESDTGLRWAITSSTSGPGQSIGRAEGDWKQGRFLFEAPADTQFARIALSYSRVGGSARAQGSFFIRNVSLELAP